MKKQAVITALMAILCLNSFSQIVFEKGYFINESDEKINCLIRNVDWLNNPTSFEYKLTQDDVVQWADVKTVKEFAIEGSVKYIRATVKVDQSSNILQKLSNDRNPIFTEETLFLKSIVEGGASLYKYENNGNPRFFYKKNDSGITQLVFKQYMLNDAVATNYYFKQQLLNDYLSQGIASKDVENIDYSEKELKRFFMNLNKTSNSDPIVYEEMKPKRDFFNLSLRAGLDRSNLTPDDSPYQLMKASFGNKYSVRFGIEAEYILPFNKNKWAIIFEPTYRYYDSKITVESFATSGETFTSSAHYHSIEFPLGIRHCFFLNNNSKIFINASFIYDISNKSSKFEGYDDNGGHYYTYMIKSRTSVSLGLGYKYKDKYSVEFRHVPSRSLLKDPFGVDVKYKAFSVIFGYTIF